MTGIRHDPWARAFPLIVEETKSAEESGAYLHPGLMDERQGPGIGWGANEGMIRRLLEERSTRLDEQESFGHDLPRREAPKHSFRDSTDEGETKSSE